MNFGTNLVSNLASILNTNGLALDGESLFIFENGVGINKVNLNNNILSTYISSNVGYLRSSLTKDWLFSSSTDGLYKTSRNSLSITKLFESYTCGVTPDVYNLYFVDGVKVQRYDLETNVITSIASNLGQVCGVVTDGDHLYVSSISQQKIYKIRSL